MGRRHGGVKFPQLYVHLHKKAADSAAPAVMQHEEVQKWEALLPSGSDCTSVSLLLLCPPPFSSEEEGFVMKGDVLSAPLPFKLKFQLRIRGASWSLLPRQQVQLSASPFRTSFFPRLSSSLEH